MAAKTAIPGASRTDAFWVDPDEVELVTDPQHPSGLFQTRALEAPRESLVLAMMACGWSRASVVVLRKNGDSKPLVDAGRRRTNACREANRRLRATGREPIKMLCVLQGGEAHDAIGVMIMENENREDLSPLDRAREAQKLLNLGRSEKDVAPLFGLSVAAFKAQQKLLELATPVQKLVEANKLAPSSAAKLSSLGHEDQVKEAEKLVAESGGKKVTGRDVEKAKRERTGKPASLAPTKTQVRALLGALGEADEVIPAAAVLRWVLDGEPHPEIDRLLKFEAA